MIARAALLAAALAVAALGGCARFHAGKLPGAPADATFVEIDGVLVRYQEAGTGPAVVLIHGFGVSSDSWLPVLPVLARDHRVIAIDLKGFGWTSRPDGDYSPAAQADLVWRVLDRLGVQDVAIVAHSWGSSVGLSMAVAQPRRVRRVALYAAYVYDEQVPSFFRWAEKPGLGEALFRLYYRQRLEDRAPLAYFDERWVTQARVDRLEAEMARPGTVAAALAVARTHHFAKLHQALRTFDKPVLLLWGDDDEVTPVRFGHRLAAELQHARIVTYPRCGHVPMLEAHQQSTRDLAAFLDEDPAAAPKDEPDGRHDEGPAAPAPAGADAPGGRAPGGDGGGDPNGDRGGDRGGDGGGGADRGSSRRRGGGGGAHAGVDDRGGGGGRGSQPAALGVAGGGGAGGGSEGGGSGGGAPDLTASIAAHAPPLPSSRAPLALPIGADLAALGAELTPRRYAAPREHTQIVVHGALRLREQGLFNLDLDRGLDARGQPIFPVPLAGGQKLEAADLRARTDVAVYAPGIGVAAKARIDWLDNVALGGDPELSNGSPATTGGQRPTAVVIKRAWGEVLTPFGVLAAGRMGAHFGLGIAANGGDCDDCDKGDAADRIAFLAPLAGHLFAVAWDVAARGPFTASRDGGHPVTLETTNSAAGPTLALLKIHSPAALARRAEAGRTSLEYGAYVSIRTQDDDVPASYLPTANPRTSFTSDDLVARGFSALTAGGWLRVTRAGFRLEAELAHARAELDQPSLIPGAEITLPVTSRQLGVAVQSELAAGPAWLGVDGGYASGDDAPGFGAFPKVGEAAPPPGSFDGAQANPPRDRTVDNFRFHPDFRIDQILFREIIGTVTDALYVRPHARVTLMTVGTGRLEARAALIASRAVEPTSTPSGEAGLGVELDPELRYATRDGFAAALTPAVFLPGPAFDSSTLEARPAYAVRLRLWFVF